MGLSGKILCGWLGLCAGVFVGGGPARAADQIGDISVSAAAIYTGDTSHGYAESRVVLENDSSKTHTVTLTSPNQSYTYGNSIGRITRTVTLAPGVQEVVTLLQPPLPGNGDSLIRVSVDGREEGTTRLPNANRHCLYSRRSGWSSGGATAFLSRSVDADAIERMLNGNRNTFSAAMATGEPDVWSRGAQTKMWRPDTSLFGLTNWLELDYDRPVSAYHLEIVYTRPAITAGFVELIGASGTNVARLALATGHTTGSPAVSPRRFAPPRGGGVTGQWVQEFSFPTTSEPVRTVRIDFGVTPPAEIAISAVALDDARGQHYATDARASSENTAVAPSVSPPGSRSSDPNSIQCLRAESALSDWSDNWLAYTPFDVVVLGPGDLATMPAAVAEAIGDYLQAGGNVVIMGARGLPAAWNGTTVDNLPDGTVTEAGFGHGFAIATTDPARLNSQTIHRLHGTITTFANYWAALPNDSAAANANLPVVENLKIPIRGITVVMLLFIVIVGPLNIFLLARKNKRTWLLWTIPAISLVTTALIFTYSLLREGITPDTRIAGLTLLDQRGHHAATYGATGFYCPLTPSDGLRFDNETEATPLVSFGNYSSAGSARAVDWTQTQHFQHGWVSSRVPAQFHLRKSGVRRERLEWQKVNGGWQIINGLGAPIQSLWLADGDLKFYQAENIPAGQPAMLTAVRGPPSPGQKGPDILFHDLGYSAPTPGPDVLNYLKPGCFIAVLEGNPFIENALGSAAQTRRTRSTAVVYGILDSPATP
jgi:hypothetical protein